MPDAVLAIDIGTQSSRAALLDPEGRLLASAAQPHELAVPRPGWAEQNPEDWWQATIDNIRDALARAPAGTRVAAVAACGQMHGTVPIARDGRLLADEVQLWCDKRAASIADEIAAHYDPAALQRVAGNVPTAAWSGFKIAWMQRRQPELYAAAWQILTPKDFINHRLTGVAATDVSEASGSFLMDPATAQWSPELAELLGLDAAKLPPIHASSAVIGGVSAEAARLTGLTAGTPVVAGSGDMLCQLLGSGVSAPGTACDTSGTASVISFYADAPVADRRLMNLHAAGPHWIAFGILDSGGGSLRWWLDGFGDAASDPDTAWERLLADAATVEPGSEGLIFLPYLLGERTLGSADSRGVFFGFHPRHTRAHATRAMLEGICCDLRQSLEIVRGAGVPLTEMRTGGGGARSALWSQIKADVYGLPVTPLQHEETGILGAAMLAMIGAGMEADTQSAGLLVETREPFPPDPATVARYDRQYALFRDLHDRLQPSFRDAARLMGEQ
ncbi:MAG: FGGY family carbohydrate kinase [Thermomicrobiales bacterium]